MHDASIRIRHVAERLQHLAEVLDPRTFRDLMGAVEVEVETGEEAVLEHRLRRRGTRGGVVLQFPPANQPGERR